MKYPVIVKLPKTFYMDHLDRLCPSGEMIRTIGKNQVEVSLDEESFYDLMSDAKHYGFGGIDWEGSDSGTRALERSARRIYQILAEIENQ